jgi:hypothetical protein
VYGAGPSRRRRPLPCDRCRLRASDRRQRTCGHGWR